MASSPPLGGNAGGCHGAVTLLLVPSLFDKKRLPSLRIQTYDNWRVLSEGQAVLADSEILPWLPHVWTKENLEERRPNAEEMETGMNCNFDLIESKAIWVMGGTVVSASGTVETHNSKGSLALDDWRSSRCRSPGTSVSRWPHYLVLDLISQSAPWGHASNPFLSGRRLGDVRTSRHLQAVEKRIWNIETSEDASLHIMTALGSVKRGQKQRPWLTSGQTGNGPLLHCSAAGDEKCCSVLLL